MPRTTIVTVNREKIALMYSCSALYRHMIANPPQNNDTLNAHIQAVVNARSQISENSVAYAHELVRWALSACHLGGIACKGFWMQEYHTASFFTLALRYPLSQLGYKALLGERSTPCALPPQLETMFKTSLQAYKATYLEMCTNKPYVQSVSVLVCCGLMMCQPGVQT